MRDFYSGFKEVYGGIPPGALTASANGVGIDLKDMAGAAFAVITGVNTGAAIFGVKMQESADNAAWSDVPAARVQSNAPAVLAATTAYRLGYLGRLRYVRLVFTYTSGASLQVACAAILKPNLRPVA